MNLIIDSERFHYCDHEKKSENKQICISGFFAYMKYILFRLCQIRMEIICCL